jgi:hypothetical protein
VQPHFEFEHNGRLFVVQTELQPDRGLHNLYYRGHFLRTEVTRRDSAKAEITTMFIKWLTDHPVSPYECHGGPLDGELMDDKGPSFVPPDVRGGRYRRTGDNYEWEH